jgi:hypothetical protein
MVEASTIIGQYERRAKSLAVCGAAMPQAARSAGNALVLSVTLEMGFTRGLPAGIKCIPYSARLYGGALVRDRFGELTGTSGDEAGGGLKQPIASQHRFTRNLLPTLAPPTPHRFRFSRCCRKKTPAPAADFLTGPENLGCPGARAGGGDF